MPAVLLALLISFQSPAFAKDLASPETVKAQMKAEDFSGAAKNLRALVKATPDDPTLWMQLGYAELKLERYAKAVAAYDKVIELGFYPQLPYYNKACALALQGETVPALEALQAAVDAGFSAEETMADDPDLASLRGDARFERIVEQVARQARPCEFEEAYRGFDFWLGTWSVTDADGVKVGQNTITREQRGCVLVEQWESVLGRTGMSMSYYDPAAKAWKHTWVAGQGWVTELSGHVDDAGAMKLSGTSINAKGEVSPMRASWTATEGSVEQVFERQKDGAWEEVFRGTYTPMEQASE